jgi:hypothetical protein
MVIRRIVSNLIRCIDEPVKKRKINKNNVQKKHTRLFRSSSEILIAAPAVATRSAP